MIEGVLRGIRCVELGIYWALPLTARIMASLGAEVIKLETSKAPEITYFTPMWAPGGYAPEYLPLKRRVSLDVRMPEGKKILYRLMEISDVFMTNFQKSALERWGIRFEELRAIKPDIIILWQTGLGGEGPYAGYKGYGQMVQHTSGVSSMTGYPGSEIPAQVNTSYADFHAAVFQPLALIGALDRRNRTGKGMIIETSIFDAGAMTVGPAVLDYQANNRLPLRMGNRDKYASPHGAYRCKGEDRWCAIAVFDDEEWEAFCKVIGNPALAKDPKLATLMDRLENVDELDQMIGEWTISHTAEEVMEQMQKAGVAAGIVAKGQDLARSAHLKERGFYHVTPYIHSETRKPPREWQAAKRPTIAFSVPIGLSETPCQFGPMRTFGQDDDYVYRELLKMSPEEIQRLTESGVLL